MRDQASTGNVQYKDCTSLCFGRPDTRHGDARYPRRPCGRKPTRAPVSTETHMPLCLSKSQIRTLRPCRDLPLYLFYVFYVTTSRRSFQNPCFTGKIKKIQPRSSLCTDLTVERVILSHPSATHFVCGLLMLFFAANQPHRIFLCGYSSFSGRSSFIFLGSCQSKHAHTHTHT